MKLEGKAELMLGASSKVRVYDTLCTLAEEPMENVDYAQLLFAAEVHKLALTLQADAGKKAALKHGFDTAAFQQWEWENQFEQFRKMALRQIAYTASEITNMVNSGECTLPASRS